MYKSKTAEAQLDLQNAPDSHHALQALIKFEEHLPTSAENAETIIQSLFDHFYKEKEAYVRAKLATLIGRTYNKTGESTIPRFKTKLAKKKWY